MNRYPLVALRAVEAAGRLGGLAKAGEELGVTAGAVSQHIRKVEAQLGRNVFERTARGLRPTAVGAPFVDALTRGFQEIARAVAAAEARPNAGLTISVAPVLAAKWLVPRLTRFYTAHPGVPLRIDASVELADLDASDIDAGVRVGTGPWPNVRAERLAGLDLFPVCSPALAERIQGLDELSGLPVIRDHGSPGRWRHWLAGQGAPDLPLGGGPVYSDAALCLEAAIAGQGVALAWPTLAVDALRSGCLRAPFARRVAS
ncbi:MAG: LysR family transcriptional regulator, partial [Hyphomicrobiales bacterium]|nr:LysR family transcriptional regulator [Hyphomicrobiales bacterium]